MQSKHPTSDMVFGAAVNNGKLLPLHFIEASLKVTTAEYLKILQIYLTPRIKKNYDPMKVMFTANSATFRGSKTVQTLILEEKLTTICALKCLPL